MIQVPQHLAQVDDNEPDPDQPQDNSKEDTQIGSTSRTISEQPEFFEMRDNEDAMEIFRGKMEELPVMPSNTVRIFLSSTFSGLWQISSINLYM